MTPDATPTISVWLVEDNRPFRETLAGLLDRTEGFSCPQAVGNAEKALRLLAAEPKPDVVLLDINLPGLDGIEALTSDTVWSLRELPKRLLVLGGGPPAGGRRL